MRCCRARRIGRARYAERRRKRGKKTGMLRALGEWFAALCVATAVTVSLFGAAEWVVSRAAEPEAVEVVTDPYTIVVDAGHGGPDGGAVGTETGVIEAGLNLEVAMRLADRLAERGMVVIMTRVDEDALGPTKRADVDERIEIFNQKEVDLVVSVHMNKFSDRRASGPRTYYMDGSVQGQNLAQSVLDAICDAIGASRRLASTGDYFVVRECSCPAVLVECGFLSNAADEQLLQQSDYQDTLADAIASGILAYLESSYFS